MNPPAKAAVLIIGGQAQSLVNFRGPLLKSLAGLGYRVIGAAPSLSADSKASSDLAGFGVSCRDIPLSRTGLNLIADLRSLIALVRLMRTEKPEVVIAYTAKPVMFGIIAAFLARVPSRYALITGLGYAFTGEATGKKRIIRSAMNLLYRFAFRAADKVFFQNPDDADTLRSLGLIPARLPVAIVNGSGVDLNRFQPAPFPAEPIRFLLIARLLSAKGIREYCSAAAIVKKKDHRVEFHLVGGLDSNPDALSPEEIKRWSEERLVEWHGEVADVRPFIQACHVYVLPSYREGTPRSVLEAMAMGRPIITTDAPGCRETVVHGENGFLVPPRAVEPLAKAMEQFIAHPQLIEPMGKRSLEIAEQKYDVEKVNAHMLREMGLG